MRRLWLLFVFLASPLVAQDVTYPSAVSATINDFATVLPDETKTRLGEALRSLARDQGVALVVVTINRRSDYGETTNLHEFATGLFNDWGIGSAERSDGILLLAAIEDRELQIVLGEGYAEVYDWLTDDILSGTILPMMQAGQIPEGIESGAYAIRDRIALPFTEGVVPERGAGQAVPNSPSGTGPRSVLPWFAGLSVLIVGIFSLGPIRRARKVCDKCGERGGMTSLRETVIQPTAETEGLARVTESCRHCGARETRDITLGKSPQAKIDTGAGKSTGGGSGGSW